LTASVARGPDGTDRPLRAALWVLQISLCLLFTWKGWTELVTGDNDLRGAVSWTADIPVPLVRVIGLVEVLGALGLVLPAATRIRPELTPMAASCLTTVMTLAVMFHLYRGDTKVFVIPAILAMAGLLVAWGRFRKAPIGPRARACGPPTFAGGASPPS
jgi:putative oxidoreductase